MGERPKAQPGFNDGLKPQSKAGHTREDSDFSASDSVDPDLVNRGRVAETSGGKLYLQRGTRPTKDLLSHVGVKKDDSTDNAFKIDPYDELAAQYAGYPHLLAEFAREADNVKPGRAANDDVPTLRRHSNESMAEIVKRTVYVPYLEQQAIPDEPEASD